MATGKLGAVYDQVKQCEADAATNVSDATDLEGYAAQNYANDQTLLQKTGAVLADANTTQSDLLALTTDTVQPPAAVTK